METQNTVQPVTPVEQQISQKQPNSKKTLYIIVGLTLLVLGGLTATMFISNQNMAYNSKAKERSYPPQSMRRYPSVTVTPGPINSTDGLNRALEELDNANTNASDAIESNIDRMEQ